MKGHYYKPNCKCKNAKGESLRTKKCSCGAKWAYIIDVGINPKTGRRKQKKKGGFPTKTAAQDAAAEVLVNVNSGTYVDESNITFEEFAKEWLVMYEATGKVKISTMRVRKHEIKRLMDYFAKLKMKDITRLIYQEALNDLKKREYAENTLAGAHGTGRMIFQKALSMGLIAKDPSEFAVIPSYQKTVEELENESDIPKYLEKEELSLFLKAAQKFGLSQDFAVFKLLAYSGMRVGELCALKWSDIDFDEETIRITKTLYNPNNNFKKYELLSPKNKQKRTIDIDQTVLNELEKHRTKQKELKMKNRKTYYDKDFVFVNQNDYPGYPEIIKTVERRMTRLLKISKLNDSLTPHSLRHTHTSLLAEAGVSLPEIMDRLGHMDDEVTKRVYLHVTKAMKKEASQKFAKLMENL